ncbi:TPA: eae-like domain protein [Escherichia coli]
MESNIKGLVAAGHEMASELKAECGAVDMRSVAKLISYLATQLEVQLVRANALAAENALARKAVQAFCDVVGDSTEVICEEIGRDGVLVILEAMKATENMPATDAFLSEVRAQGVEMMREHPSIKLCSLTHICDELAAQLRKGGSQ